MNKTLLTIILVVFFSINLTAQNYPTGLLTDLLSNTDKVYINGYLSTVSLKDLDNVVEPIQFSEVFSSHPSFSWVVPGNENATEQIAYRIVLSDTPKDAVGVIGKIWDSGKVQSNKSVAIVYNGGDLKPEKTYYWRVKTFTNKGGESQWSAIKAFHTGRQLRPYSSSYEQLQKTIEYPLKITSTIADVQLADFGKDAFSQVVLRLTSLSGTDTVQINMGEAILNNNRIDPKPGGTIRYREFKLPLIKGNHTYRIKVEKDKRNTGSAAVKMPGHIGEVLPFRYVEVAGYKRLLTNMDIFRESVHYPFNENAGSFKSSNETLNQIWELSKYSIKATSFAGIYVDGDRERIPYEADALINQLGHYSVDREYSMARRSIEYLFKQPTWPTEWILQALVISWNDYLYTGDSRSLATNYELLKSRTLSQLTEKNGLISTTTGLQTEKFASSINFKEKIRDIVDWPIPETDGFVFTNYNAVTNAWHYRALVLMEKIAKALGKREDVIFYNAKHKNFKIVYNNFFFNRKKGVYKDGDTTDHASLHTNMFAVNFGLVPSKYIASVMNFIRSKGMACSVYGSQFLMESLYDGFNADYALSLLTATNDRSWYNMLKAGSTITLEAWDNKYKPNQDWNHAWGAAPANIIPRKLMGVEPLTPGFETVSIRPQIASLSFTESVIPTIRGEIKMMIENKVNYKMSIILPANMMAEVYLPIISGKDKITHNGKVLKEKRINGQKFLYVGKIPSGTHTFILGKS